MKQNGYPEKWTNSIIDRVSLKMSNTSKSDNDRDCNTSKNNNNDANFSDKRKFYRLPYVNKGSANLKRILENLDPRIKIAFGNVNVLQSHVFSRVKDQTPLMKRSGIVYKIPCLDCSGVYVGETEQYLKRRFDAHKYDLNHIDKDSTALAAHKKSLGHNINLEGASILAYENVYSKRKIREVIEIISSNQAMNFKSDSKELYAFYAQVLTK